MNSPTLNFEKVTFSDGSSLDLDTSDVVVFVGPNNSGKSLALVELELHLAAANRVKETKVIRSASTRQEGSPEEYKIFSQENIRAVNQGTHWTFTSSGGSISTSEKLEQLLPTHIHSFKSLFCKRIPTETRILDSNPVDAIDGVNDIPVHPIHMMFKSADIESRISKHFRRAFAEDLIADRAASSKWSLLVGQRLLPSNGEDRITPSYLSRVRDTSVQLNQQGDGMRSFASVILHLLAPTTFTLLLLDEPEAFLHPSQARILGEIIVSEKQHNAQLFLATHSADVLEGLTNGIPEHLRIVRIQRDGNVNRIKELDKEIVKKVSYSPVMRYTSVLSGLFHERVFVCESDADCMFYKSILDLPCVHGESHLDVHFVHANGKDRMATLAETLTSLDVPVDVIADIDVLNDLTVLKKIVMALNGEWNQLEPLAKAFKKEIENSVSGSWKTVQRGGYDSLPGGQIAQQFNAIKSICKRARLWIVPVGELERFCKTVCGKGPNWTQKVIEATGFSTNPELEDARQFVKEIWDRNGVW